MDTRKWLELCFCPTSRSKKSLFAWIFKSLQRACRGCRINVAKGSQNKSLLRFFESQATGADRLRRDRARPFVCTLLDSQTPSLTPPLLFHKHILYISPILRTDFFLDFLFRQPFEIFHTQFVCRDVCLACHNPPFHEESLLAGQSHLLRGRRGWRCRSW
jgi:hypothetical protein